ncbi:MAG: transporter substrate-binding domain-containing protein, partial [Planctomycetia bacterium]
PLVVGVSLLAFIGLSAVAAAMCLAVTTASKSGKEAQNTLTPVLLIASTLAGAGLVVDPGRSFFIPAVPFAGQVSLARATLESDDRPVPREAATPGGGTLGADGLPARPAAVGGIERLILPLALSLVSSAVLVWMLLQVTATLLTDEEILFRGPDVAGSPWSRPARRRRPSPAQGFTALAIGLAGLWYAQGLAPADFALAIPVQQFAAVGLPLALLLAWQRVDLRRTFGLRWPGSGEGGASWRTAASLLGAALVGAGLFVLGAAVLLAIRGTHVSAEAKSLAEKLITMMRDKPVWLSWALIAVVPAICEELLFRGWVQSAAVGAWPSRGRAVAGGVAQAVCCAIFHLLPDRMPQTFALGLVTGAMTLASRSLLPAVACHAAHNSMPLLLLWLAGGLSKGTAGAADPASGAATAAAGLTLPAWMVATAAASVAVGTAILWLAVRGRPGSAFGGRATGRFPAALLVAVLACACGSAGGVAAAAEVPARLRVGVVPIASVVDWEGDEPTGTMVEVWRDLARRLGVEWEFVRAANFHSLLEMLPAGEVDVALGPLAITEERERVFDLTHPVFHSGLRVAVRKRSEAGFLTALRSLLSWQLVQLLGTVLLLVLASGHLLWWFEHRGNPESFPRAYPRGVWEAIWWIASTVVVGGCDNKHVASVLGRAIAFAWMVGSIVLLAAFTSVLTATLTAAQVTGAIRGPKDLAGRTVGCQEAAVTVTEVRQRGGTVREFAGFDDALDALAAGEVEAVVGEAQQLMFLLNEARHPGLELVGPMFESFDYGLGLPAGSPFREPLNTAILRMREDDTLDRIREQWLGRHD